MRILVLGATGYVGSRVVPALLEAGHSVVAASSSEPDPGRFAWGDDVDWARCDVTDGDAVRTALTDVDGVCYLVHSLDERSFRDRDRVGAETVRDAACGQRRTPRGLPLRVGAGRSDRRAVRPHRLTSRGGGDPRAGHVGRPHRARAPGGRRDRCRVHLVRGDPSAGLAAPGPADPGAPRAPGPADRRQRRPPRHGRGLPCDRSGAGPRTRVGCRRHRWSRCAGVLRAVD